MTNFTLFQARKSEIASNISAIEAQIVALQQRLVDEQAFLQELGTVEQAGQSAINQAMTFLSMVRAIDPTQESVFWQAMDALKQQAPVIAPFAEAQAAVQEDIEDLEAIKTEIEQDATINVSATDVTDTDATDILEALDKIKDEVIAIGDVESAKYPLLGDSTDAPTQTTEEDTADQPVLNVDDGATSSTTPLLTAAQVSALSWSKLKKLASDRNIADPTGQRLTRKYVESKLLGVLTQADIA